MYNYNYFLNKYNFFTQSDGVLRYGAIGQHARVAFAIADVDAGGGADHMDIATRITDAASAGVDEVWESGNVIA